MFKSTSSKIIALLNSKNNGYYDCEEEYGHCFKGIPVGIYRDLKEDDVKSAIEDARISRTYNKYKEELQHDLEKSKHFSTIGIGVKGYYNM